MLDHVLLSKETILKLCLSLQMSILKKRVFITYDRWLLYNVQIHVFISIFRSRLEPMNVVTGYFKGGTDEQSGSISQAERDLSLDPARFTRIYPQELRQS